MGKKLDANNLERSNTHMEYVRKQIEAVVSEETAKFINDEKKAALEKSEEYRKAKETLKRIEVAVLTPVVNKIYARLIAKAVYKVIWNEKSANTYVANVTGKEDVNENDKLFFDTLATAFCDKNGQMYKNGKSVAVGTVQQATSFFCEWEKGLKVTTRKQKTECEKIESDYRGAAAIGCFTDEEICEKLAEKYGVSVDAVKAIVTQKEEKHK